MTGSSQRPSRFALFASRLAAFLAISIPLTAQTASLQRLTPAQSKEVSQILDQLPSGVEMGNYPHQETQRFMLRASDQEDLMIAPVLLNNASNPNTNLVGPGLQCGAYLIKQDGKSHYIGMEWSTATVGDASVYNASCFGVVGVGAARDPGPRPRLIFLFSEESGAGPTGSIRFRVPYILSWNAKTREYELDAKTTIWVQHQKGGDTVADTRRLLAQYDAAERKQ